MSKSNDPKAELTREQREGIERAVRRAVDALREINRVAHQMMRTQEEAEDAYFLWAGRRGTGEPEVDWKDFVADLAVGGYAGVEVDEDFALDVLKERILGPEEEE